MFPARSFQGQKTEKSMFPARCMIHKQHAETGYTLFDISFYIPRRYYKQWILRFFASGKRGQKALLWETSWSPNKPRGIIGRTSGKQSVPCNFASMPLFQPRKFLSSFRPNTLHATPYTLHPYTLFFMGSSTLKVVPFPSSLSTSILPWWASMIFLQWKRPIPIPCFLVVWKGRKR